mmetsp:Transcript_18122/g.30957  ORF Transcript_18122/g.30957 Transcript_18122/m.30957 type:complete len:280 (+) Transcript_18122:685-1524(+)
MQRFAFENETSANLTLAGPSSYEDVNEFEKLTQNKTLYLEIVDHSEEGAKHSQVLEIADFRPSRVVKNHLNNAKLDRERMCLSKMGFYDKHLHICHEFYWAMEICASIDKNTESGLWFLDSDRYNQSSYGCAFYNKNQYNRMMKLDGMINQKQVWQKLYVQKNRPVSLLFPFKFQPLEVTLRHGGDPIIAAENLTPQQGSFDFGESSRQKFINATTLMSTAFFLIILICLRFKREGGCDWARYDTPEEKYRKMIKLKLQKERERDERRKQRSGGVPYED